jgi:hypothetical protein
MATTNPEQKLPTTPPVTPATVGVAAAPAIAGATSAAATAVASAAVIEQWYSNLSSSVVIFAIITLILVGITIAIFSFGNLAEISKNFAKYRCNPLMMPFAGQFGYDAKENFNFCITNILNNKAAEIFAPLYGILSQFTSILTVMMNATLGIRKLFSNFFLSVNSFIGNVRNRIQNLLLQIRISFLKMNNLMARVFGTMYAVIYMGTSALTAGNNLANNDLVTFLSEFCFDPATPIQMANGSWKAIKDIVVGERLAPLLGSQGIGVLVTSTFVFDGSRTPVVRIGDVVLSSQHYVEYMGEWIYAADHPSAVNATKIPKLICLNVTGNAFYVGRCGLKARDYDETNDPGITEHVMKLAIQTLNGGSCCTDLNRPVLDYSLGFDPRFEVKLADGEWKPAQDVQIGAKLAGGAAVVGLVHERCDGLVKLGNLYVSDAQLLFSGGKWMRAAVAAPENRFRQESAVLISFVTEGSAPIEVRGSDGVVYHLRDYREVALPEMETPYEDFLRSPIQDEFLSLQQHMQHAV